MKAEDIPPDLVPGTSHWVLLREDSGAVWRVCEIGTWPHSETVHDGDRYRLVTEERPVLWLPGSDMQMHVDDRDIVRFGPVVEPPQ